MLRETESNALQELTDRVTGELLSGKDRLVVINELVASGMPLQNARQLVDEVEGIRIRPIREARCLRISALAAMGLAAGIVVMYLVRPYTPPIGIRHPVEFVYAWMLACGLTLVYGILGCIKHRSIAQN
jgi:hypothetical protein